MAKKMRKLFAMLLTVCMVMSLLSVAASAESTDYQCGLEAHTHTEECYETTLKCEKHVCEAEGCETPTVKDLICKKEPHDHTVEAGCYHKHTAQKCYPLNCSEQYDCSKQYDCTEQYDCTNSEEGHVHGEGCPAHVHVDGCYDTTAAVICGKTEEALEGNLVCTKEVHAHVEDVAAENSCYQLHEHVADCYKTELTCTTPEHTHVAGCEYGLGVVALVGETPYKTLKDAVAAANASEAGGAVIELLDNVTLSEKLTVKKTATIDGNDYTITRGHAGTLFAVDKNVTLTLDGGLVIDGDNNWIFDSSYYTDMAAGLTLSTGAKSSYTTSDGIQATAALITISGTSGVVEMNNATIQNCWGAGVFAVPAGATLNTNTGSLIQHIRGRVSGSTNGDSMGGTWTMNGGKIDDVFCHNGNGGLAYIRYNGVVNINGGEITNVRTLGLNANGNGILFQVYGDYDAYNTKLNINGGYIHDNASFSPGGGWGSQIYLNRGGGFTMTGGIVEATKSDKCTAFVSNYATSIELLGGTIEVDPSTAASFDSLFCGNVTVGPNMQIVGTDGSLFCVLGETANEKMDIDGQISGGTMWLLYSEPVTGSGTITSDVLIRKESYFGHPSQITIAEGNWLDSLITVDSIGTDASLTVKPGVVINGKQVRVLNSVDSADYTNVTEAAAVQAAAYVEESGASVTSPVLHYHRLAANQKQNIVVTYDYNGGLDASGWSGCQITSASSFVPTAPAPTNGNLILAGWAYAVDNDPECLTMESGAAYNGEEITQSLRLIAQWATEGGTGPIVTPNIPGPITPVGPNTPDVNIDEEDVPLGQLPEEEVEIGEEDVPLTELPEEDVPLAMAPETGDASAIWAVMSALSGAGLFLNRKKREDEE